jgi:hypothetical protein
MPTVPSDASCPKATLARVVAALLQTGARRPRGLMCRSLQTGVRGLSAVFLRRRQ